MGNVLERARFDHIGIITDTPQEGEQWGEGSMAWITNPRAHPFHVEWVRFHPDSPVTGPMRTEPHIAFRVDDLEAALEGYDVISEPMDVGNGFMRIGFINLDGAIIEFMQYANPDEEGWV